MHFLRKTLAYVVFYTYICHASFYVMEKIKILASSLLALSLLPTQAQEHKTQWFDNVKLSGFAIAQYQASAPKDNHANTFHVKMARLSLEGDVARDFHWKTQIHFSGNTSTLGSSPRMIDLWLEWQKYDWARIRVGELLVPFTLESPLHPIDVDFMDGGQGVNKFAGYTDRSGQHNSNGRDIGVMVQGDLLPNARGRKLLHYAVSVVNGQGINLKDVDQRKNIVGCLWLMPIEGMRIGFSGWEGSYARKGTWTDEATGEEKSGVRSLPQHRYAISADYNAQGWTFRSEYMHATGYAFATVMQDDKDAADCTLSAAGNKADGFYVLGIAPVVKDKVNIKARYDLYRDNGHWDSAKAFYEVGADYLFGKSLKLTAEYARVNDRTLPERHNYNMVDMELSFRF